MSTSKNKNLLILIVLLAIVMFLNDHIFKYTYSNTLTGKLSDFIGLFIFPIFLSFFFEKHILKILFITGLGFIYYKLPISDPFIHWLNEFLPFRIQRTVDISDFIALISLPLVFLVLKSPFRLKPLKFENQLINYVSYSFLILTFFSTSIMKPTFPAKGNLVIENICQVPYSEQKTVGILDSIGFEVTQDSLYISTNGTYVGSPYYTIDYIVSKTNNIPDTIKKVNFFINEISDKKSEIRFINVEVQNGWKLQEKEGLKSAKEKVEHDIKEIIIDPLLGTVN